MPDEVAGSGQLEKSAESEKGDDGSPPLDAELLVDQPKVQRMMDVMVSAVSTRVGARNPLLDKLSSEQIDKYLDYGRESERDEYALRRTDRWFRLGYVGAGIGVFVFLVLYLLPVAPDTLGDILRLALVFGGGFGAGYGVRGRKRPSQ